MSEALLVPLEPSTKTMHVPNQAVFGPPRLCPSLCKAGPTCTLHWGSQLELQALRLRIWAPTLQWAVLTSGNHS